MAEGDHRIVRIALDEKYPVRRKPEVEHERQVAIFDLLEENRFVPQGEFTGPYHLHLSIEENRLVFDLRDSAETPLTSFSLPILLFKNVVKDYFLVCESYYSAIPKASPSQIEVLDMARRSLHNEGSELLRERLAGKVEMDIDTARRLFTLICVLHIRG